MGRSQLLGFDGKFSEPREARVSVKNFPGFCRGGKTAALSFYILNATLAQLAEQALRKRQVRGSIPRGGFVGFIILFTIIGVFLLTALVSFGIAQNRAVREKLLVSIRVVDQLEVVWRDWLFAPLVLPISRTGIHPNVITLLGFALSIALAMMFFKSADPWGIFLIALVAALTDTFDGMVARASGKVTSIGGLLDGIRDFLLFLVLTAGILVYHLAPPALIVAFFAGNALVGLLKLREVFLRLDVNGFFSSVARRGRGEGKLSIDRIKFTFYAVGCLAAILGQTGVGWAVVATPIIFWLSILWVTISIAAHSVIIVSLKK